jgi:hypothetical protein
MTYPHDMKCLRCGADEQGTHHPLCQSRDGTPTNLSDAEVRAALKDDAAQHEYLADLLDRMDSHERKLLLNYARELCDAEPFDFPADG